MNIEKLKEHQHEYLIIQEKKRRLDELEKQLKDSVKKMMGEEKEANLGNGYCFQRSVREKREYDAEYLKNRLGDLYEKILTPNPKKVEETIKFLQWTPIEREELKKSMKVIKQFEILTLKKVKE